MSDDKFGVEGTLTFVENVYEIDYSRGALSFGLKIEGGQPWLGLEPLELAVIANALRSGPETPNLKMIREFCEGALHYVEAGGMTLKKGNA